MPASAAGARSQFKNPFFRSLFRPGRKCHKINPPLAAEAAPPIAMPLLPTSYSPRRGRLEPRCSEGGPSLQVGTDKEFLRRRVILNAQHIGLAAHLAVVNGTLLTSRGLIYGRRVAL